MRHRAVFDHRSGAARHYLPSRGVGVLGILSPLVLLPARLFNGPDHMPTLEGQYVLKDVILLAATMVIATTVRRRSHH